MLVDIIEDDVKLALHLVDQIECITHEDFDSITHAGFLEVTLRLRRIRRASVGVIHLTSPPESPSPPNRGISNGRPHFKNTSCVHKPGKLVQQAAYCWTDNRNIIFLRHTFHVRQHGIARRKEAVHVLFNALKSNPIHLL